MSAKVSLGGRVKHMLGSIGERFGKKILLGSVALLVVVAIVVSVVLFTRPNYPDRIELGEHIEGDLTVNLTLIKGEQDADQKYSYELTGNAQVKWAGTATIELSLQTSEGEEGIEVPVALERGEWRSISEAFSVAGPVKSCEVWRIKYGGKMRAHDFITIENLPLGRTLTTGPNEFGGTAKEACQIMFNANPVPLDEDMRFSVVAEIAEGPNALAFEVEVDGKKDTYSISITGELPPDQYKASCPAGPPYPNLNKNPEAFAGTRCRYRGKAVQVMESGGKTDIRMDITPRGYGWWKDTIYVVYDGTTPAVEDSILVVYGEITGSHTYTSVAGFTITLPQIKAKYIDVQ